MSENTGEGSEVTQQNVTRTDIGSSIEATLKRGEGTRDEDRVKIKGKGRTAEEALNEFETLLERYEEELGQRLRNVDPKKESSGSEE